VPITDGGASVSTGWKMLEDAISVLAAKLATDEAGPIVSIKDMGAAKRIR
jgi:hypothetical protein